MSSYKPETAPIGRHAAPEPADEKDAPRLQKPDRRRYELDACRIFACVMVVMLHAAASGWHTDPHTFQWAVCNLADQAVRGGVPLFFMISGVLFLGRETFDTKKFFTRNVPHLIFIYFLWSAIYTTVDVCIKYPKGGVLDIINSVIKGHYHLWFLPAMIMVYLLLPLIHGAIHGKKINLIYLLAVAAVIVLLKQNLLLIPYKPVFIKTLANKMDFTYFQYVGYLVWGYWLSSRQFGLKTRILAPLIYCAVTILAAGGTMWYSLELGKANGWLYNNFSIPTAIQATCIFCFFQTFRGKTFRFPKLLKSLSACTLGIYLLHPMVIETFKRFDIGVHRMNAAISVPLFFLVVLFVTACVIFPATKIPLVRKLIQ